MSAKIVTVSPGHLLIPEEPQRLWFFPDGSALLRYAPHFHMIMGSGLRQNLPLSHMFVVVLEGKVSIKNFYGRTIERIDVRDQVWFYRGRSKAAQDVYAQLFGRTDHGPEESHMGS